MPSVKRMNDVDLFVSKQIRARRKKVGVSQEALGHTLGISFQQVQKYERGANRVTAGRLAKIAEQLDVPITYFFPRRR